MRIKFLKPGRWRKSANVGEPIEVSVGDILEVSSQTAEYAINSGCAEIALVNNLEAEPEPEPEKPKKGKKSRNNPAHQDRDNGEYEG